MTDSTHKYDEINTAAVLQCNNCCCVSVSYRRLSVSVSQPLK